MSASRTGAKAAASARPVSKLVVAAAICAASFAASAAPVEMYLKLGDLVGDSTADKFATWIPITSYGVGVDNPGAAAPEGAPGGIPPSCAPLAIVKDIDRTSPVLLAAAISGGRFDRAEIDVVSTEKTVFLRYEFRDVTLTAVTAAASGGNRPNETLALSYGKLRISYYPQNGSTGGMGENVTATIDCARLAAR